VTILIGSDLLAKISIHGERSYPEEGTGFLLGSDGGVRIVKDLMPIANAREEAARHNRYLIGPREYLEAETEAGRRGLDLVGIFHSHPDHPSQPSAFDLEWAQPAFSYVITSVQSGKAVASRAWRLNEDRSGFTEEEIKTTA
jgi:proteasome lid subunit RPN8/RPN11